MPDATFVVPVAPYHEALLERTLASVQAQTVAAAIVVVRDTQRRGAGWARNEGLKQVTTPFVSFLDADDEVLPQFVERTRAAWQWGRYVYTDWLDEGVPYRAPKCPWINGSRNVITTLLRTDDARAVGGFDEALHGMEDTHFYLKLLSAGVCGVHVEKPLFRYSKDGQRSKVFYNTPAYHAAIQRFNAEFGSRPMAECGGCGGSPYAMPEIANLPVGDAQPGDVLAEALWAGNRAERGRITGRLYPRVSAGKRLYMAPQDIDAAPHLFARIVELPGKPQESDFQKWARGVMQHVVGKPSQPEIMPVQSASVNVPVKADVGTVLRLYAQTR